MTDKEMAFEIAQWILRQQMKEIAANGVFERYASQKSELAHEFLKGYEELLSDPCFADRTAELKKTFDAAMPGDDLIQILHRELAFGYRNRS
jgi:hypothetical protein